jgi:hypothetical protein
MATEVKLSLSDLLTVSASCYNQLETEIAARQLDSLDSEVKVSQRNMPERKGQEVSFGDPIKVIEIPSHEKVFNLNSISVEEMKTEQIRRGKDEILRVIDPVYQYLQMNPDSEPRVMVGLLTMSLKTVLPMVNEVRTVESILDNGSSIVSMAKNMALELGLGWNPRMRIYLESANNTVNRSLGIAENVPFHFNHITIHLQVHILVDTAYEILLGCPFDCLTQSNLQNFMNGDQMLTLNSPHSRDQVVILTYDCGKIPAKAEPYL